jgi:putative transposase
MAMQPSDFPPWQAVYHVFRKWNKKNVWDALNNQLHATARDAHGKRSRPSATILDSQSVESDPYSGSVGYDARKRIKGRKRHILVDALGLLLGVHITPASTSDRCGAKELLGGVLPRV